MSKRMRKIKLTKAVEQEAVAFHFGENQVNVTHELTELVDDLADLIEQQYPAWTEHVGEPKAATPAKTLKVD